MNIFLIAYGYNVKNSFVLGLFMLYFNKNEETKIRKTKINITQTYLKAQGT